YLRSDVPRERLAGARYFARSASTSDLALLRRLRRDDDDPWTQAALDQAIRRAGSIVEESVIEVEPPDDVEEAIRRDAYAQAVEETAQQLVHEIRRLLAFTTLAAEDEIETFDQSRTSYE